MKEQDTICCRCRKRKSNFGYTSIGICKTCLNKDFDGNEEKFNIYAEYHIEE
jgi:hypothetical protein